MKVRYIITSVCALCITTWTIAQSSLVYDNVNVANMQSEDHLASSTIQAIYQYYIDKKSLTPSETELLSMARTTTMPTDLEEIYHNNVWLHIAQYCYLEGSGYSTLENSSAELLIPDRKLGSLNLLFDNLQDKYRHVIDARVQHKFDNLPLIIKKVKNNYYFVEEKYLGTDKADHRVIVNYSNGLLIYESTATGKPGDFTTHRRFRHAALAIPKSLLERTNTSNMPVISSSVPLMQFDNDGGWKPHLKPTASKPVVEVSPVYQPTPFEEEQSYDEVDHHVEVYSEPAANADMYSQRELKGFRPGQRIASGLDEALYNMDWLEIGGLMWYQGEDYWGNADMAPLFRFSKDGGLDEYEINVNEAGTKTPKWKGAVLDQALRVERRGNFTFITNGKDGTDRIEYTVLHYDGKYLVVDEFDAISGIRVRKVWKSTPRVK